MRTFRATVRGRFHELSDPARRHLVAEQDEHEIFKSAYTPEGTLTYDSELDFFNLRYELRADHESAASSAALDEAETFLRVMTFGFRDLRVSVVDMSTIWPDR